MATFAPPTYDYSAVEGTPRNHPGYALFRHYTWRRARSVQIKDGTAQPLAAESPRSFSQDDIDNSDDGSGLDGKAFYLGGHKYPITATERTALETAGYTVKEDVYAYGYTSGGY